MTKDRFDIVKSKLIKDGWVISDKLKQFTFPTLKGDKRALFSYCKAFNELAEENIELHIQLDFLKDENQHMRYLVNNNEQLQERNNRQAKQLDKLYTLIEKQDWKTLKGIIQEFQECEEQLQKEWSDLDD